MNSSEEIIQRVKFALAKNPMVSAVLSLMLKGAGSVLAILVFMLAARKMDAHSFGELVIWFNAISIVAVVATFGQDTLIVRSWGEYTGNSQFGLARGAYKFGWRAVFVSAAIWLAIVVAGWRLYDPKGDWLKILAAGAFLFAQATLHYNSHACRTILNFRVSETHREITWRMIVLAFILVASASAITTTTFLFACAAGMALSHIFDFAAMRRGMPSDVREAKPQMKVREWMGRSRIMCTSASVEAIAQYAEVVLLGLIVSPAVAGGYFVAARFGNIFPMIGTGLHTYTVAHAAKLYYSGQTKKLQGVLRSIMIAATLMCVPLLAVMLVFGKPLLGLFGEHFRAEYTTLVILALSNFVATLAGPTSGILQMAGHERFYSLTVIAATLLRMALLAVLASLYGTVGAAISWALVTVPVALILVWRCTALCKVNPSVAAILPGRLFATLKPEKARA